MNTQNEYIIIEKGGLYMSMTFHERIRQLRLDGGYMQKDVAEKLKIPKTTYNNYETGFREPDFDTVLKIADFFNVSIDYLLGKSNEKNFISKNTNLKEELSKATITLLEDIEDMHLTPDQARIVLKNAIESMKISKIQMDKQKD